jgi:hypothetical protein
MKSEIRSLIRKGIPLLAAEQDARGSFPSFTSPDPKRFSEAYSCPSVFSTTLILSCLEPCKEDVRAHKVREKAARFLLEQKSRHWTFNYWARESEDAAKMPYPDDLDDTSCALAALYGYDHALIDGEVLAHFVTVLTAVEEREGGPYRTWIVSEHADAAWKDVDIAVNANIAHFLSLHDISLPEVERFLEERIGRAEYVSPYYPGPLPIVYFLSRFYRGEKVRDIVEYVLGKRSGSGTWDNPLDTALAVTILLNFGVDPHEVGQAVEAILSQKEDLLRPFPFYTGINPYGDKRRYVAGSVSLTAAFVVEALAKYLGKMERGAEKAVHSLSDTKESSLVRSHIVRLAQKRFLSLDGDLKNGAIRVLEAMLEKDKDGQIVLLPCYSKEALGIPKKSVSRHQVVSLGLVSLFGWMAYTLYDDFLDGEGDARLLPVANLCLRDLSVLLHSLFSHKTAFAASFREIMDRMEGVNGWEVSNCQFSVRNGVLRLPDPLPDYGDYRVLAERSLGHAVGFLAVLGLAGYSPKSLEWQRALLLFRHLLIARQLNDDAHDWEEDLRRGRIDSVGAEVLKVWRRRYPTATEIRIEEDMPKLRDIFWYEVVSGICRTVLSHTEEADAALRKLKLSSPGVFAEWIAAQRRVAERALKEREETLRFLWAYQGTRDIVGAKKPA